jgi:hypothetical protein
LENLRVTKSKSPIQEPCSFAAQVSLERAREGVMARAAFYGAPHGGSEPSRGAEYAMRLSQSLVTVGEELQALLTHYNIEGVV